MIIASKLSYQDAPPDAPSGGDWQVVGDWTDTTAWHPQVAALLCYWRGRHAGGHLPSRHAVDPFSLRAILPCLWMLDVQRAPWRFRYRLAGTRFVELLGFEVTRRWYDEVRPQAYGANRTRLITVARDGVATWRRGPMPLETGDWQQTENLMLPLAADGEKPDIILGISVRYDSAGRVLS
jgi:hypothetical protein